MTERGPTGVSRDELFIRLFLEHQRRIFSFIFSLVPLWNDADDLLQETATTMWQKFETFEEGTDFMAWALSVARFRVLNYRKARQRSQLRFTDACIEMLADAAAEHHGQSSDHRLEALHRCVSRLEEGDRELIRLRYEPGATTRSVAEALGRSVNSVYKLLNRIHRQLLHCVRNTLQVENGR